MTSRSLGASCVESAENEKTPLAGNENPRKMRKENREAELALQIYKPLDMAESRMTKLAALDCCL